MNILYLGVDEGTAAHRAAALGRLGHVVKQINPDLFVPQDRLRAKFHWETGGVFCENSVADQVFAQLDDTKFDLVLVNSGRYIGPRVIHELRRSHGPIINYNTDDPYGMRDRYSWSLYKKSVPLYDLVVVVREENVAEAKVLGAKQVLRVYMSADEVAHAPRPLTSEDHRRWDSEVVFVGTYMAERGPFLAELIRRGVPLTIHGGRWQRAKEWPLLQKAWKGPAITCDDDYAKALQCAKVTLGLLSKGNRDLHTQRSLEAPFLGAVFCAERTSEHEFLYREGEEAVFWSDAAECAEACRKLLANNDLRQEIARRGRERAIRNGHMNEQIMANIITQVISPQS